LSEDEAFEIVHADGEKILLDMTNKISKIFDKNIAALKVTKSRFNISHFCSKMMLTLLECKPN